MIQAFSLPASLNTSPEKQIPSSKTGRPVLVDFYALSGTGKSTHSKALHDHLTAEGFKAKMIQFSLRRNGGKGSFAKLQRLPIPTLFKSITMGFRFLRISPRDSNVTKIFYLIRWSYRLLVYDNQIRNHLSKDLDYIILDASLSSKLNKFHRYFDDTSIVEAVSFLEENKLLSDIVVIIEADVSIVKKRRLARGTPREVKWESAAFFVRKAFSEIERRKTYMNFITVRYDCFSSLKGNILKISELCTRVKSGL